MRKGEGKQKKTQMQHGVDPHDLENWYEPLREWTFETVFLELSERELELICDVHDGKVLVAELDGLRARLEPLVGAEGAFVRLSTRSAKDWALRAERTRALFEQERAALDLEGECAGSSDVRDVIALVRAMSFALRVRSAAEAVEMLTGSERSYQDCVRRRLAPAAAGPMLIVVRKWQALQPELELRGFVFQKQLTGLSQYYKACFSPQLARLAPVVQRAALAAVQRLRDRLALSSYVLDLVYMPALDVCRVVELNHWAKTTSSALFDWTADIDLLENGPFVFRYLAEPLPHVRGLIAAPLRALAGWSEDSVVRDAKPPPPPAAAAEKPPKKPRRLARLLAAEARRWRLVGAAPAATVLAQLNAAAARRRPPFFAPADVSLLFEAAPLFVRGGGVLSAEGCVGPSLYVCLFLRVAGAGGHGPVEAALGALRSAEQLRLDVRNAALVLRELGLVESVAKE